MTGLGPSAPSRHRGLVVAVVVSLLAGIGLGVTVLRGVFPTMPRAAAAVGPALDLHAVDWGDATLPGSVCRSPAPIRLRDGQAQSVPSTFEGPTPNYPQDAVVDGEAVVYGDLTGDGRDEAAVPLRCSNHDSTLAGTTVVTVLLFDGSSGAADLLGELASSQPRLGEIPNGVTVTRLSPGRVDGEETFYAPQDGTCCPSGRAVTAWPWTGGTLGPPAARVVTAAGTAAGTDPVAPSTTSGDAGVDAAAVALNAARATPQLDRSRVVGARCATSYLTVVGGAIGCGIRDQSDRRVAIVEEMLVDLATRNVATYVAVPGSGCPGLPDWAAKNVGDMEGDNPC